MRGRLLYLCVGDGSDSGAVAPAAQTGAVASAGGMMTCGRRWIEEPRLFDRKSDDFPSQSLLTSGLDGRPSSSLHCLPRVHHPHAADANAPVCAAGATTPEPDPGVEGREEGAGSARRADRREIVVCGRGECVGGRGEGAGFAQRANRREFVDWCEVWR